MAIEKKIKILGAVLELPAKQHSQFSPFGPVFEVNGLDWHCCPPAPGSSKTAPRILILFQLPWVPEKNGWSGRLAYKSTLEKQYFIVSEPKGEVINSKIDQMAAF